MFAFVATGGARTRVMKVGLPNKCHSKFRCARVPQSRYFVCVGIAGPGGGSKMGSGNEGARRAVQDMHFAGFPISIIVQQS